MHLVVNNTNKVNKPEMIYEGMRVFNWQAAALDEVRTTLFALFALLSSPTRVTSK